MTLAQFAFYMATILIAPLLAVQASEWIAGRREGRNRRLWIFRTLMATRANRLSPEHVQALNMIDLDFQRKRHFKAVRVAWKTYFNHLNQDASSVAGWADKGAELFFALLSEMARVHGYEVDREDIRSRLYSPVAHGQLEKDQARVRSSLLEVLDGTRPIVIRAWKSDDPPPST